MGIEVTRNVGKTGVVGTLKVGDSDHIIGFRADMDAINIQETSDIPHKSNYDYNDNVLLPGAEFFKERAENKLKK